MLGTVHCCAFAAINDRGHTMNMHINATLGLSHAAFQALVDAAVSEAEQARSVSRAAVEQAVAALIPYYREWDQRGGFAHGADCNALFAVWERETP
jgi:hypothetical protein